MHKTRVSHYYFIIFLPTKTEQIIGVTSRETPPVIVGWGLIEDTNVEFDLLVMLYRFVILE